MSALGEQTSALLDRAHDAYAGSEHEARVVSLRQRFDAPLRVAIAGKIKAGKSTLLNALVGVQVAPTDATECTRIVTWYQDGLVYDVRVHPANGPPIQGSIKTTEQGAAIDLGGLDADRVERLVVTWPSQELRTKTLIDSPGIGSLSRDVSTRTMDFLNPEDEETPADAVLYLMKHLHGQDVELLRSFHDENVSHANPINAIGILSRADEIGSGRVDAMDSARKVADRMGSDPRVRRLVQTVVPVAGLLAETAATLTESEFQAIRALAQLPETRLDRMLISADHFVASVDDIPVGAAERQHLLDRLAVFGVRKATAGLRSGAVSTAKELSSELTQTSGLSELRRLLETLFIDRRQVLKSRSALLGLDELLSSTPPPDGEALSRRLEEILSSDHAVEELRTLSAIRSGRITAKPDLLAEMERLVGASGTAAHTRLDLAPEASTDMIHSAAMDAIARWRRRAENPLTDRDLAAACGVVLRSCEGIIVEMEA